MPTAVINQTFKRPLQKGQNNFVPLTSPKHNGHLQNRHQIPVALLPDEEVLILSYSFMEPDQQRELGDLLADQREGMIDEAGRKRLAELLEISNRGLLRKSEALVEAVRRGLRPRLSE
ncbi:MAG: hypothetical protein ACPGWR_26380 [Ardenticatenaceae bacterium]